MSKMVFRRKSTKLGDDADAGPCIIVPKGKSFKRRVTYGSGDEIVVTKMEDLPGYPGSMDGWKFVRNLDSPDTPEGAIPPLSTNAKLKAVHVGRDRWKVIVDNPGFDRLEPNGSPMQRGQKVHIGWIIGKERAETFAATGVDPGIFDEAM
jgi:hypothetical protein